MKSNNITSLYCTEKEDVIVGFRDKGIMIATDQGRQWTTVKFHSDSLDKIYEDRFGQVWLTAIDFGLTRLDLNTLTTRFYILTPDELKPLTDLERPQFYEDRQNNLWIGLHGSGLGLYDR